MKSLFRWAVPLLTLSLLAFFAYYFVQHFAKVSVLFATADAWRIALGILGNVLGTLVLVWVWPLTVRAFDPQATLSTTRGMIVGTYGWFARYVPGKVVAIASKIIQTRADEANKAAVSSASVIHDLLNVGASFVLAPLFLYFFNDSAFQLGGVSMMLMGLSLVLLFLFSEGRYIQKGINWLCAKLGKTPMVFESGLSVLARFKLILSFCMAHVIRAWGFAMLISAFFSEPSMQLLMGTFILASALGILSVVTPSGLGVKEGVLLAILTPIIGLQNSLLVSIIARIWEMLVDALMLLMAWLIDRKLSQAKAGINPGLTS